MPAVLVPDLKRKLELLRSYPVEKTWAEFASDFGVPYKTLQSWQDGSATRDPGLLPGSAMPTLIRLVGEMLPERRSEDALKRLVLGPAVDLEDEVRAGPSGSLMALIASEGRRDTATMFVRPDRIELVEVAVEPRPGCERIGLGQMFRITFRKRLRSSRVLVLQHVQQTWGVVPAGLSSAGPALILAPGSDAAGEPLFMAERRDLGRHLFACFEADEPLPSPLRTHAQDQITVDRRALSALVEFYAAQPHDKRACHVLEVELVPAGQT